MEKELEHEIKKLTKTTGQDSDFLNSPKTIIDAISNLIHPQKKNTLIESLLMLMQQYDSELKSFLKDASVNLNSHPDIWNECAYFFTRAIRGELSPKNRYPNFDRSVDFLNKMFGNNNFNEQYLWEKKWQTILDNLT